MPIQTGPDRPVPARSAVQVQMQVLVLVLVPKITPEHAAFLMIFFNLSSILRLDGARDTEGALDVRDGRSLVADPSLSHRLYRRDKLVRAAVSA